MRDLGRGSWERGGESKKVSSRSRKKDGGIGTGQRKRCNFEKGERREINWVTSAKKKLAK